MEKSYLADASIYFTFSSNITAIIANKNGRGKGPMSAFRFKPMSALHNGRTIGTNHQPDHHRATVKDKCCFRKRL